MNELQMLLKEKRKIEEKIEMLKRGCMNFGQFENVRYLKNPNAKDKRIWQVSARMKQIHREYEKDRMTIKVEYETDRWQIFIREKTIEETKSKISQIINDLNRVLDDLKKLQAEDGRQA